MRSRDRFRGCLLGLAVGDAVGTAVEFQPRGSFSPLTDLVGGGPFGLAAGEWTDDTSMALCLATSLVEVGGFDVRDQIARYVQWMEQGVLSSTGACFSIGATVASALRRYQRDGDPFAGPSDPRSAGNGSLMRLAPVPMYFFPDEPAAEHYAAESSRTTHQAAEALDACRLLARMTVRALRGDTRDQVAFADRDTFSGEPAIEAIARGSWRDKREDEIRGSGYVVESLEAALWCFTRASDFAEAVLMAANLGDDADTTAAVCGQLAGAHFGESGIPREWLERVALRREITGLADRLMEAGG